MHSKISRFQLYFTLAAVFFAQLTFLDYLKISGAKPDLGLAFIIFFAIFFGPATGFEAGFFFGLLKDLFYAGVFGINAATLALTGLAAGYFSPKLFRESKITQFFLVFAFTAFSFFLHYLAALAVSRTTHTGLSEYLFGLIIPDSLYTAFVSAIIFPVLINRFRLKENEEYL